MSQRGARYLVGAVLERTIRDDFDRIDDEIRSLDTDLVNQRVALAQHTADVAHAPLQVFYLNRWAPFHKSWLDFHTSTAIPTGDSTFDISQRASIDARLRDYQNRLIDLRSSAPMVRESAPPVTSPMSPTSLAPLVSTPVPLPQSLEGRADRPRAKVTGLHIALGVAAVAAIGVASFALSRRS